jgi:hypothetical protein
MAFSSKPYVCLTCGGAMATSGEHTHGVVHNVTLTDIGACDGGEWSSHNVMEITCSVCLAWLTERVAVRSSLRHPGGMRSWELKDGVDGELELDEANLRHSAIAAGLAVFHVDRYMFATRGVLA